MVTELPVFVRDDDAILVDGRPLRSRERRIYVMLNKPLRTVTTVQDEPGLDRRTVMDLVDHPAGVRLFPVGRLDYETTGLLLLTNDGDLANALTHPRFGLEKTYRVVVRGLLEDDEVAKIERGIYLADQKAAREAGKPVASRTARVGVEIIKRDRDRTMLNLTLKEGRNRQVRRMLAAVGYPVRKLERIAIGPLKLKGLSRGAWRELTREEVRTLREAVKRAKSGRPRGRKGRASQEGVPDGSGGRASSRRSAGASRKRPPGRADTRRRGRSRES
jgi:pseudouridine synthase